MSETVFHRSLPADNKAADLGYGVLDTAMVETAAYCVQRTNPVPSAAVRG